MDTSFCTGALDDALVRATPEILNTVQGSQFTSDAFAERVLGAGVAFSMDGRGRFLDRSGSPPGDRGLRCTQRKFPRALKPNRNPP